MTKKVSEPQVEYKKTKHQVLYARTIKDKVKISSLRGKLGMKQSDNEITSQIEELRKEWERDT
jgi:hypothetical protein